MVWEKTYAEGKIDGKVCLVITKAKRHKSCKLYDGQNRNPSLKVSNCLSCFCGSRKVELCKVWQLKETSFVGLTSLSGKYDKRRNSLIFPPRTLCVFLIQVRRKCRVE